MSPPDLVMVKDQLESGNETSPGCFSIGTEGEEEVSAGRVVVPVPVLLLLFLTPTGRPRFFSMKNFYLVYVLRKICSTISYLD